MTLLMVEDEKIIRQGIRAMVQKLYPNLHIDEASNGVEALAMVADTAYDVVLIDVNMPEMNGLELARHLRAYPMRKIVISGFDDFHYAVEMMQHGVIDYLLKPVARKQLKTALDKAFNPLPVVAPLETHVPTVAHEPMTPTEPPNTEEKIAQALVYIGEHFSRPIDMALVANYVDMNYYVFSQAFKKQVGISFVRYLRELRINQAKHMLTSANKTVKQIARDVGYGDDKVFSKVFKNAVGISPNSYKRGEQR